LQPQQTPATQPNKGPIAKSKSEARATMRAIRKEIAENVHARRTQGQKPHPVRVKASGE